MIGDLTAGALMVAGCLFFAAGTVGLLRFAALEDRLHALAKADVLGLGLVVAGLAVHAGHVGVTAKLLLLWLLALLAAAVNAHLLARPDARPQDGTP